MYRSFRPLIFTLCPETAHNAALSALRAGILPAQAIPSYPRLEQDLWGYRFKHPLGLAAGFDKNAEVCAAVAAQGMAFVECGTVTPKPQSGNPKPRIFRIVEQEAVINRLGFNNKGLEAYRRNTSRYAQRSFVLGGNIGKNKDSIDAVADYVTCFEAIYDTVDYITVNISSPNTPGLRDLQAEDALNVLIKTLHEKRALRLQASEPYKPIFVKIAPDLAGEAIEMIAHTALSHVLDGLIISNTTITRPNIHPMKPEWEAGGLSGKPLMPLATQTLAAIARGTKGKIPLIGVGGVSSAEDMYEKILHGASLVQLYTALIYQGFSMIPKLISGLDALLVRDGFAHVCDAVGKKL